MAMDSSLPPLPPSEGGDSSGPAIIMISLILAFILLGFFSVYCLKCLAGSLSPSGGALSGESANQGLDQSLIQSFPTFLYSSIKEFRKDQKCALECAICLVEFEDDSNLRLLTVCYHVFHQECIDRWLESQKTCPVCRRNLDGPQTLTEGVPEFALNNVAPNDPQAESTEDAVRIDIHEDGEDEARGEISDSKPSPSKMEFNWEKNDRHLPSFHRSHTTGHSVSKCREKGDEEEDRFTLRLPMDVRIKISRGENWTGSSRTFPEYSHRPGNPCCSDESSGPGTSNQSFSKS